MKTIWKITPFLFVFLIVAICGKAQSLVLENIRCITADTVFFTKPVWSPDGKQLLLTGQNNRGLFLYDTVKKSIEHVNNNIRMKNKPVWLNSGEIAYSERNKISYISRFKTTATDTAKILLVVNTRKQKVESVSFTGDAKRDITPDKGLYYNPVVSPDGKKTVIHLGSQMYLYATDGSGMIKKLGTGLASSWSADSEYVFYFLDTSIDGHQTTNSELYVVNILTNAHQPLTQTNDMIEMWPDVSPDGKNIAFADQKTGLIFTATIKTSCE
ncbi:MAG: hypothetical protein R6W78_10865 [Bacteroidales bacterium]